MNVSLSLFDRAGYRGVVPAAPNGADLELRKHIRRSDNLQVDVFWNDYFGKPPTLSFEVFSLHPCLLLVVEPPICFLDIRKQEGLEGWLKCFSPVCENLLISLVFVYSRWMD
jgi:hypothetical protein